MSCESSFELSHVLDSCITDTTSVGMLDLATVPFPQLPLELRELVYRYAILPEYYIPGSYHVDFSAADTVQGRDLRCPYWLPDLCKVNEATRIEVGLFMIRNTEFGILYTTHVPSFTRFLATFPNNEGFRAVRRLDFPLFGRYQPEDGEENAYIAFMKRCSELTEVSIKLSIKLEVGDLIKPRLSPVERVWLERKDVVAINRTFLVGQNQTVGTYRLHGLFDLGSLTKITIEVWSMVRISAKYGFRTMGIDCMPEIVRVAQWIREGFGERGKPVHVEVVEACSPGLRWKRTR